MRETPSGTLMVLGAAVGFGTVGVFGELAATVGPALSTLFVLCVAAIRGWSVPRTRGGS